MHIITNGFADVQSRKMYNAKIESYFQTITNSEMAGVKKPNPGIFNYALAQANAAVALLSLHPLLPNAPTDVELYQFTPPSLLPSC